LFGIVDQLTELDLAALRLLAIHACHNDARLTTLRWAVVANKN